MSLDGVNGLVRLDAEPREVRSIADHTAVSSFLTTKTDAAE